MTSSRVVDESECYITAAAVPGTSHVKNDGLPCQDFARAWQGEDMVIVALSDGHGGADYERSDVGSRLAVDSAIDVVRAAIQGWREDAGHFEAPRRERVIAEAARSHLCRRLLLEWYRRVHLHDRMMREFGAEGATELNEAGWTPIVRLYGATLLAAAVFDGLCLILQLGDGEIVLVSADGAADRVFDPAEKRFGSSATNSLSLEPRQEHTPADLMEVACRELGVDDLRFLLICSDGVSDPYQVANQQAREARRQEEVHTIWGSRHLEELEKAEDHNSWYTWCDQLTRRLSLIGKESGDDASVAVAWWPDGPWTRSEASTSAPDGEPGDVTPQEAEDEAADRSEQRTEEEAGELLRGDASEESETTTRPAREDSGPAPRT